MKNSRRQFLKGLAAVTATIAIVPRHVLGNGFVAPSDKINIGFIGCGKQSNGLGNRFLKLSDIQMVAAADIDSEKLRIFREKCESFYAEKAGKGAWTGLSAYADYHQILDRKDIDAVIIATPDHWHALPSIEAMKAGKDVYCEKPLSHTVEEGRKMVKAARKYDRVFQTGSMQRSSENFRHACELVRNGYLGEIKTVLVNVGDPAIACDLPAEEAPASLNWNTWLGAAEARPYNHLLAPSHTENFWPRWRDYREFGGGILSDWGAHMFDIAQWGLGMDNSGPAGFIPPADKSAKRGLKMVYANGVEMIHEDFDRGWAVRFIGTEGSLDVSRQFLDSKPEKIVKEQIKDSQTRMYKSDNHYADWTAAIRDRTRPICDVETGHRSASVCNLANIAYELGRPLKWNPVKEKFEGDAEANKKLGKKYRKGFKV